MSKSSKKKKNLKKSKKKSTTGKKETLKKVNTLTRIITSLKRSPKTVLIVLCIVVVGVLSVIVLPKFFVEEPGELSIVYPFDGSLFPPEIIAPKFWWTDENSAVNKWQITVEFEDNEGPIKTEIDTTEWIPEKDTWESIKRRTLEKKAKVTIKRIKEFAGIKKALSGKSISISTSRDSVNAPIFYRDVPLPFRFALRNVHLIHWRLGDISSYETPPKV